MKTDWTISGRTLRIILVVAVLGTLAAEALALSVLPPAPTDGGGTAVTPVTVIIPAGAGGNTSLNYTPTAMTLVIGVNNTVTFTNQDTGKQTVTAPDGSFNSGDIPPGGSWTYTFSTPGTFTYYSLHHYWLKGTITVLAG